MICQIPTGVGKVDIFSLILEGSDWVCHPEEWVTMPRGFDNTWALVKASDFDTDSFCFTVSFFSLLLLHLVF